MARKALALLITALILFAPTMTATAQDSSSDNGVVGPWIVKVTTEDGYSFYNLETYSSDGVVTSSNLPAAATDPTAPVDTLYLPTGVGAWEHKDDGTIDVTLVLLYGDIDGNLIVTETVRWNMEVDESGQTFQAAATFVGALPTGEQVYGGSAVLHGQRIGMLDHGTPVTLPGSDATPEATPAS